ANLLTHDQGQRVGAGGLAGACPGLWARGAFVLFPLSTSECRVRGFKSQSRTGSLDSSLCFALCEASPAEQGSDLLSFAGYYRYYNKYVNVKKGSVAGVSMVLAAYVLFNYCRSYKELKHERRRKYH
uniref:ATP synthase F(0) complex subunit f, mitochondrial n=1 Tax=Rhinolophus ferrumequinum TaxID=59479 RepID=A0A671DXK3_RHIFE